MIMPLETSVSEPADNALNTTHATTQQNNGKDTSAAVDVVTSEKGCHGNARRLRERAGKVEWKGDNQPVVCSWLIDVDPQYGIVFQFLALSLQRGDTRDKDDSLTVYRGHQLDNGKQLRRVVGNLPVPPVVERSSQLYISLETHGLYNRTRKGESSFTFSYKTYLSREIPLLTDRGRYNCSAPYIVPEAFRCDMVEQCYAGEDEVNYNCTYHEPRCEKGWIFANWTTCDLLRSNVYRVCLWIFSLLAMLGNTGVLVYRLCLEAEAGFLALVSSEVSAFIVCIITLDRLLVLRFPLKRHLHLTWRSTMVACGAAWVMGIALAMVPLLPTTGWEFYSQTGICLPLPITRANFPGKQYAFGVFIVLNFVLFLLIVSGQILIYRAVRSTSLDDRTQRRQQDMAIARRLFLIVFSDYCCWFPVCVMGLLASQGTPIAGEFNVLAAIFVMPINSAINPFLYTLNTLLERRSKRRCDLPSDSEDFVNVHADQEISEVTKRSAAEIDREETPGDVLDKKEDDAPRNSRSAVVKRSSEDKYITVEVAYFMDRHYVEKMAHNYPSITTAQQLVDLSILKWRMVQSYDVRYAGNADEVCLLGLNHDKLIGCPKNSMGFMGNDMFLFLPCYRDRLDTYLRRLKLLLEIRHLYSCQVRCYYASGEVSTDRYMAPDATPCNDYLDRFDREELGITFRCVTGKCRTQAIRSPVCLSVGESGGFMENRDSRMLGEIINVLSFCFETMPARYFSRRIHIKNWAAALIGLSLFLAFLYVTGLMSYVPLLNRMVARKEPVIVTPLPPKIIHGHGRPPH
nr:hypothetical protein BaRGS_031062 [Batillaria attramentaria]